MRLLLDTQVYRRLLVDFPKRSRTARALFAKVNTTPVSAASRAPRSQRRMHNTPVSKLASWWGQP